MIVKRAKLIRAKQLLSAIPKGTKTPGGQYHSIISNQLVSVALVISIGIWPFSKLGLVPLMFLLGLCLYTVRQTIREALIYAVRDLIHWELQHSFNIDCYDPSVDAFLHKNGINYHDPSADECWRDTTLLFNLNSRRFQDETEKIVSRVDLGGSDIDKVVFERFFSSPFSYLKIFLSFDPRKRAKAFLQNNLSERIAL